ncbi:MAG TPA: cyclic nucleotide-binding domain-containing protein [Candidatus Krumholzibacteria bacterium]|nr:cyclic nucleotide-binding domain-containing protein [Candidatus Krumholzibacteria bacterium]
MVSPELLRQYPLFASFDDHELKAISALADEVTVEAGTTLFEAGQSAAYFYLLIEGVVEWHYDMVNPTSSELRKDVHILDYSPGEPFGISALLETHLYLGRADVRSRSRLLRMDGPRLRALCELDTGMGPVLLRAITAAAMERLTKMRALMAAARSEP